MHDSGRGGRARDVKTTASGQGDGEQRGGAAAGPKSGVWSCPAIFRLVRSQTVMERMQGHGAGAPPVVTVTLYPWMVPRVL